jgi:hypothetical protein
MCVGRWLAVCREPVALLALALVLSLLSERQAQICGSACPHKADGYQRASERAVAVRPLPSSPMHHAFETIAPYLECQTVRLELSSHGPVPTRFFYYCARASELLGRTSIRSCCCENADVRLCLCVRRPTFALSCMHAICICSYPHTFNSILFQFKCQQNQFTL